MERLPQDLPCELVGFELVQGMAQRAGQTPHPAPGELFVAVVIGVVLDRLSRIEPVADTVQPRGEHHRGGEVEVAGAVRLALTSRQRRFIGRRAIRVRLLWP